MKKNKALEESNKLKKRKFIGYSSLVIFLATLFLAGRLWLNGHFGYDYNDLRETGYVLNPVEKILRDKVAKDLNMVILYSDVNNKDHLERVKHLKSDDKFPLNSDIIKAAEELTKQGRKAKGGSASSTAKMTFSGMSVVCSILINHDDFGTENNYILYHELAHCKDARNVRSSSIEYDQQSAMDLVKNLDYNVIDTAKFHDQIIRYSGTLNKELFASVIALWDSYKSHGYKYYVETLRMAYKVHYRHDYNLNSGIYSVSLAIESLNNMILNSELNFEMSDEQVFNKVWNDAKVHYPPLEKLIVSGMVLNRDIKKTRKYSHVLEGDEDLSAYKERLKNLNWTKSF